MGHRIYVDDHLTPYEFKDEEFDILDCLEKQGVEMDSHCRAGFCGACKAILLRGAIHYPGGTPIVYLREGEILPCCCEPTTDIEIQTSA